MKRWLAGTLLALPCAAIFAANMIAFSGCAPVMKCQILGDLRTRREVEVCEKRVCRDLATRELVKCPGDE